MKKGQVTLFVILGIVVLAVVGLGIYFRESLIQQTTEAQQAEKALVQPEVQQIYDHVFYCMDKTAKESMTLIGLQGGYYQPPENSIPIEGEGISIAIGYDRGDSKLPSLEGIRAEMETYVNAMLPECVDLSQFEGFTFTQSRPIAKIEILDYSVKFEVSYPITAKKAETTYSLDKPSKISYLVRLKRIHEVSQKIINKEINDPSTIDVNYMLDLGIDIDVLPVEEGQVVYLLTDDESKLDDMPYVFMFGNRF
ncbi:MAG: hypothetical protein V1906_02735 [Candidatus Woesearchaeota archaeon]